MTKSVCMCIKMSECVCQCVRQARGKMAECSIQGRLNEGFVHFAPDVESVFYFYILGLRPVYILDWTGSI